MAQDSHEAAQTIALRAEISSVRLFLVRAVCPILRITEFERLSPLVWMLQKQIESIDSQVTVIGEHCTSEACEKIISLLRQEIEELKKTMPMN